MDILKTEQFTTPAVGDSGQPSLTQSSQKESEDSRRSPIVNSSDQEKNKNGHLETPGGADSSIPKENSAGSFPKKEREEMPPSSIPSKTMVHFDQPNRLVWRHALNVSFIICACKAGRI